MSIPAVVFNDAFNDEHQKIGINIYREGDHTLMDAVTTDLIGNTQEYIQRVLVDRQAAHDWAIAILKAEGAKTVVCKY